MVLLAVRRFDRTLGAMGRPRRPDRALRAFVRAVRMLVHRLVRVDGAATRAAGRGEQVREAVPAGVLALIATALLASAAFLAPFFALFAALLALLLAGVAAVGKAGHGCSLMIKYRRCGEVWMGIGVVARVVSLIWVSLE